MFSEVILNFGLMPRLKRLEIPGAWIAPVNGFEGHLVASGRPSTTVRLRVLWVRRFAREIGAGPGGVSLEMIEAWSASYDWAADTRKSAHASVRAFFAWAERAGVVGESPAKLLAVIKSPVRVRPGASRGQIAQALERSDARVGLMIRLASEAGLRRGEVAKVAARDLGEDLLGPCLVVHGKGGKDRTVPITAGLAREITRQARGGFAFPGNDNGHLSAPHVGKLVAGALPHGVIMHDLRRGFATRAYQASGDLLAVQELLGHASPDTTRRYVSLPSGRLRQVMAAAV